MRPAALLLATLTAVHLPSAAADWLETTWRCDWLGMCGYSPNGARYTHFHTDFGSYEVDATEGCRGTGVPGMTEFCMDWTNTRGHFRFSGQNRRCIKKNPAGDRYNCDWVACYHDIWPEVPCTW
jgi:hypothetical protein